MSRGGRSHNPHDSLVRYTFSRPEAVAVLLRRLVRPELLPFIDFESLRPLPTVHSDAQLQTRAGDLRFVVDLVDEGRRMPLQLAIEHQSTLDLRLPCRTHVYVGDMWSQFIREHPEERTVPPIIPIVLAQHPARHTPRRLSDVLGLTPRLRRLVDPFVELTLLVDDLCGSVLDDRVAAPETLALVEITRALLHAYRNPDAFESERMVGLAPQFDLLLQRNDPVGEEDVRALWRYSITVFGRDSPLRRIIVDAVGRKAAQMYITIADDLRAKGRAEGRAAARAEAVLGVLAHRGMAISDDLRQHVTATRDECLLQRWFDDAFVIASPRELFEAPAR